MLGAATIACCAGLALAQSSPQGSGDSTASPHSTGRTVAPDSKGQKQPQGHTGPLETEGRSAPAESPQGQTPPNMQAAPEGSGKTIVEPKR
jgi:hypothetical protein